MKNCSVTQCSRNWTRNILVLLAAVVGSTLCQSTAPSSDSTTYSEGTISNFDRFLRIPPEYAALLGLGIVFILLFIIVIIIICITGRAGKE